MTMTQKFCKAWKSSATGADIGKLDGFGERYYCSLTLTNLRKSERKRFLTMKK